MTLEEKVDEIFEDFMIGINPDDYLAIDVMKLKQQLLTLISEVANEEDEKRVLMSIEILKELIKEKDAEIKQLLAINECKDKQIEQLHNIRKLLGKEG